MSSPVEEMDRRMAEVSEKIHRLSARRRWIEAEATIAGLHRACWLIAALAFLIVVIINRRHENEAIAYGALWAAAAFGLSHLAVWVMKGFIVK